jgi:hypothetical protein
VTEAADILDSKNLLFPRIAFPVALLPDPVRPMSTIRISLSTPNSTVDVSAMTLHETVNKHFQNGSQCKDTTHKACILVTYPI